MDWRPIHQRWKNSILQLIVIKAAYNIYRPYLNPPDHGLSASGFIIDLAKGHVISNAHVAADALDIRAYSPLLGRESLSLTVHKLCKQRDISILILSKESIAKLMSRISKKDQLDMPLVDHLGLVETDEVLAIGYPLGQDNVKFTTGVVSGFQDHIREFNGLEPRDELPSYIQITAALNPGNSGGPLLNRQGQVVGVNSAGFQSSQGIGYAVGSRLVLTILSELIKPTGDVVLQAPRASFDWNATTDALWKKLNVRDTGVLITQVYPDSSFPKLRALDILSKIGYQQDRCNLEAKIDNYGDITIKDMKMPRRVTIKEFFELVPVDSLVSLHIYRDGKPLILTQKYINRGAPEIRFVYPLFEQQDYEIVAGMCISQLTLNHIEEANSLIPYSQGAKRYEPRLIIDRIFPTSLAAEVSVLQDASILKSVNGREVHTLKDLGDVLRYFDYLELETESPKRIFIIDKERELLDTKKAEEEFA